MSNDKPIIKDNRLIRVTGVYGKDNQLKNYKPSAPVELNIDKLLMPKLDYENGFNKGGAVMKKKKTKMMAKGGMAKKKTKMNVLKVLLKGGNYINTLTFQYHLHLGIHLIQIFL